MNNQFNNEIPKYLKQKESNVSKAKKKSKHKHQYEECLIQCNSSIRKGRIITSLHYQIFEIEHELIQCYHLYQLTF